ncbi:MAG: beta-glucosidase [Lachnospiraceae bacterium]|nr:beta-glucosidase [Lachnospiraceae bacterium]
MGFSENFKWGVASASYQIEGGWNEDGKSPSIWDSFSHKPGAVYEGQNGDIAADAYHLYEKDLDIMQEMGIKNYRLSLSWPRIIPEADRKVNGAGLAYYDKVVDGCLKRGIEPWLTLYHWDLPQRLEDKGGWRNRETVDEFAVYAEAVGRHFKGRVKNFFTLNEPQCIAGLGYATGEYAPGLKLKPEEVFTVWHHLMLAHGVGYDALRKEVPEARISLASTGKLGYLKELSGDIPEGLKEYSFRTTDRDGNGWFFNHQWVFDPVCRGHYPDDPGSPWAKAAAAVPQSDLDIIAKKPDFISLNIYNGHEIVMDGSGHAGEAVRYNGFPRTAIGWPITPEVMYWGTRQIYDRYGLPIVISEDGISCTDVISLDGKVHDPNRIDFLHRYLSALKRAAEDGVPVEGYLQWSFTDNFEWSKGYSERFGLIYVDYRDCSRIPKDSAEWYAEVVRTNGENL